MGRLAAELQVELSRPTGSALQDGTRLEKLRLEIDELGWVLSILSAAGEGQPSLARHLESGLAVLLEHALGERLEQAPGLAAAPGVELAWHLVSWLWSVHATGLTIEWLTAEAVWLVAATPRAVGRSLATRGSSEAWLRAQGLSPTLSKEKCMLEVPAAWFSAEDAHG
jgi:hypothetical protein